MTTLAYLRKSRAEKNDPDVLRKHRATIIHAASLAGHDLKPLHIHEEVGSGEYLHTRPVFLKVLAILERVPKEPRTNLWVMDVDRLARGEQTERALVGKAIRDANALIWMPAGGVIDLHQADQRLLWQVKGDLAENELAKYKHRVAIARAQMLREGKVRTGNVPEFGYRWSKDLQKPIIQPLEFPILQSLLHDALTHSIDDLAERYGLPVNLVRNAIRNPFMCGYPAKRTAGGWEWPARAGDYPPAITRDEWERLQVAIGSRKNARDSYRSAKGWCRDVLQFRGQEGARITLGRRLGAETYETRLKGSKSLYVARSSVHEEAAQAVREALSSAGLLEYLRARVAAQRGEKIRSRSEGAAQSQELQQLRADLLALERRELRAIDAEDRLAIDTLRREVKREIEQLRVVSHPRDTAIDCVSLLAACETMAADWETLWPEATDAERRLLTGGLLRKIVVQVTKEPGERQHRRVITCLKRTW